MGQGGGRKSHSVSSPDRSTSFVQAKGPFLFPLYSWKQALNGVLSLPRTKVVHKVTSMTSCCLHKNKLEPQKSGPWTQAL